MSVPARLDFATEGPAGKPRLLVEAKGVSRSEPEWARDWRRNVIRHDAEGPTSERLTDVTLALVTLERIFVWPVGAAPNALPSQVLDTMGHLGSYFARVKSSPASVTPRGFEQLVSWWLKDLTNPHRVAELSDNHRRELERSGLLTALLGAQLVEESTARW